MWITAYACLPALRVFGCNVSFVRYDNETWPQLLENHGSAMKTTFRSLKNLQARKATLNLEQDRQVAVYFRDETLIWILWSAAADDEENEELGELDEQEDSDKRMMREKIARNEKYNCCAEAILVALIGKYTHGGCESTATRGGSRLFSRYWIAWYLPWSYYNRNILCELESVGANSQTLASWEDFWKMWRPFPKRVVPRWTMISTKSRKPSTISDLFSNFLKNQIVHGQRLRRKLYAVLRSLYKQPPRMLFEAMKICPLSALPPIAACSLHWCPLSNQWLNCRWNNSPSDRVAIANPQKQPQTTRG